MNLFKHNIIISERRDMVKITDMVKKDILPAIDKFIFTLAATAEKTKALLPAVSGKYECSRIAKLSELENSIFEKVTELEKLLADADFTDSLKCAEYYRFTIFAAMQSLRVDVDTAERITSAEFWPYPSYGELLFGVR